LGSGIELPAFAHHVSAAPKSFFQLPELNFGLIPGAGGCASISRRIGRQHTAWMVLSGKKINARQALAWGLIDEIRDSGGC
jgi:enoyl-CoA hydratase/carnithine racemase